MADQSMIDVDAIEWPTHLASLSITHNDHKNNHETVEQALGTGSRDSWWTYDTAEFPDEAEIAKAIAADSVWTIQWYPHTPVGFYRVHAATLGRALEFALTRGVEG